MKTGELGARKPGLSSATCKLGSLRQSSSPQLASVYTPVKWPVKTPCKMGVRHSSQTLSNTTSDVTLGYSRSLLAGVSNKCSGEAHLPSDKENKHHLRVWQLLLRQVCPIHSCCHSHGDQRWPPRDRACGSYSSKPFSIWQNPAGSSLKSQIIHSKLSFGELHSINMQTSLEVAHNPPTYTRRVLIPEALMYSQKGKFRGGEKGGSREN